MSRIIVKNIPPNIKEDELKAHFSFKGDVTDVKIMKTDNGKSRKFAFIGFKLEEDGKKCVKYFNNTYLKTNQILVEEAKVQGDSSLTKPWSRHSKWVDEKTSINGKSLDKKNTEKISVDKESKIKKLLEISKLTSVKSKFDAIGKKISEAEKGLINGDNKFENNQMQDKENVLTIIHNDNNLLRLDAKRLYIRNLPFKVEPKELRNLLEKYGEVTEIHIPINYRTNESFGYGYVSFATLESAVLALGELDKSVFQGRILHIEPAEAKKESVIPLPDIGSKQKGKKSEYRNKKEKELLDNYSNETNWNYLFINQNAAVEAVAKKLGVDKSELLSKENTNLAVQVSSMETVIINETKKWLSENGIDIDKLKGSRQGCVRSNTTILIKNIGLSVKEEDLKKIFSHYGMLSRFILSPSNTLGIAEFIDEKHAENCIKNCSYYNVEGLPLYLEYAPEGLMKDLKKKKAAEKINDNDDKNVTSENKLDLVNDSGKIIFVSNLNFKSTEDDLKNHFIDNGFNVTGVRIATHKKNDTILSSGFGFLELESIKEALKVIKTMQGTLLHDHSLKLSIAKSKVEKTPTMLGNKRKSDFHGDYDYAGEDINTTKLLIKNVAFEATTQELRQLLKDYGEIKSVRFPSKIDGTHRGFAFVDFVSHDEAKNVFLNLQNSHFYGRKLVIEWAEKEKTLEELRSQTERKLKINNIETHRKQIKTTFEPEPKNKKQKY